MQHTTPLLIAEPGKKAEISQKTKTTTSSGTTLEFAPILVHH
jgi:hypothetical protein